MSDTPEGRRRQQQQQQQQPLQVDATALERLHALEHAVQFIASDTAQLLGGLQAGLQSVRSFLYAQTPMCMCTCMHLCSP